MTDPAEDICDALVTYVSALASPAVSLTAEVRKTDNPLAELEREHDGLRVLFYDSAEEAERIGRGGEVLERFVITMMVVRKIGEEFSKKVLSTYTRELKAAVRGVRMATHPFTGDATPVRCDAQQMMVGQFVSVSEFTYSKAGTT